MIKIGLLGLGTVGQGVYEIISQKKCSTVDGDALCISKVLVRNKNKKRAVDIPAGMLTDRFEDILNDDSVSVIVSVLGGTEPELTYIRRALMRGKHVVTANKEIISKHIAELLSLARENGAILMFEAAVGGGIPIISSLIDILKTNRITRINGILNGTTNYILTKITREKRPFEEVLKEAQAIGFAEADPNADIDGYDIMRKICILSSIAFKTVIREDQVHMRGIGNVTYDDIRMADEYGYIIKYLAKGVLIDNRFSVSVTPALIKKTSVISNVNEENNIILLSGDIIGELCFIGKGAGKNATANAVVSDVLKVTAHDENYAKLRFDAVLESSGIEDITNEYYIRVSVKDYEQFSYTIDTVSAAVKTVKLYYGRGKIFFMTENIGSPIMNDLYNRLKDKTEDVFYARREHHLI
jgi:homoserine dehydrogenase